MSDYSVYVDNENDIGVHDSNVYSMLEEIRDLLQQILVQITPPKTGAMTFTLGSIKCPRCKGDWFGGSIPHICPDGKSPSTNDFSMPAAITEPVAPDKT